MKIAFFSTKSYDKKYFDIYKDSTQINYHESPLNEETTTLINGENAVCVFVNDILNAKVIEQLHLKGIKIIALRCAGFNNVDIKKAHELNIKIVRVPAYSPYAVAEHTCALLLTLNRKIHKAYNRVKEGNFSIENLEGFDLNEKKIGIIGTGKIGEIFANIMLGFGCEIYAYDIHKNETLTHKIKYVEKEILFKECDIISLHCPLNENTKYIINDSSFSLMKTGVYIINTGRGALLNSKDTIKSLKSGKIGGLAIDVYEQEGNIFFSDHSNEIIQDDVLARLTTFPNVLITSHQGFFTKEALTQIAKTTIQNVMEIVQKGNCENEILL